MRGTSGALGDELVFRQRAGKTIISLPPVPRPDNPTDEQNSIRTKFQEATRYARTIMANPTLKELYAARAKGGVTAFNLAFADFFKAPEIIAVDLDDYTGAVGNTITVLATDNFKVQTVFVSIQDDEGNLVEEGAAVINADNDDFWTYTATTANATPAAGTVIVRASDLPGNMTVQEVEL